MKKATLIGVFLMFVMAFFATADFSFAGDQCSAYKSNKSADGAKTTAINATKDAKQCPAGKAGACCAGKEVRIVSTDADKQNEANASLAVATFSVKGMTCGGCESQVSSKLAVQEGVSEVLEVDHKSAKAVIKYNPDKADPVKLAAAVSKLGYETEVIPAEQEADKNTTETETKEL